MRVATHRKQEMSAIHPFKENEINSYEDSDDKTGDKTATDDSSASAHIMR